MLEQNPRKLALMARLLGASPDNARRVFVALIALHDIGKFAEAFQCKVPGAWPAKALGPLQVAQGPHHTQTAFDLREKLDFPGLLTPALTEQAWSYQVDALWAAVAGHHGRPVSGDGSTTTIDGMKKAGVAAALAYAKAVMALFAPFEPLAKPDRAKLAALSWSLAGLTNLADWIGSDRTHFPYCSSDISLTDYWAQARECAKRAITASGMAPVPSATALSAERLFPNIVMPSPLQSHLGAVDLPEGPVLAIVEDVTGSGKTEASVLLAARLIEGGRADGLFFALPTMATANAMFDRLGESYRRLFADTAQPSLVLAHGRRALHAGFEASILPLASNRVSNRNAEARGDESSAVCAAWIADDRRKAFLAHVGVGTIDQAFLGALPTKHQALRLWGLADKVLIVDEAHAYDAYMGRELERLLEFHAALGGSAIILSATLPAAQREALTKAFAKGVGAMPQVEAVSDYPLVTLVSAAGVQVQPVATRNDRQRRLPVRAIESVDTAVAHVVDMAERGAAVAWIRNSVDDAIEAVEALRQQRLEPVLLHARFAMGDRLKVEERVRATLGRNGDPAKRKGFVLVGTQILEQSLDYDVDAMIADLAPIDLVIQRAGRLWRHTERNHRPVDAPELLVFAPDWRTVADRNWYRQMSPRAAAVYAHHGIVWRSAKALVQTGCIETPDGVRGLIERVYVGNELEDIPQPLRKASQDAEGRYRAAQSIARANLLVVGDAYGGNNANWQADTVTPTRLGEAVTVFRIGRIESGSVVPWCHADDGDVRRAWALSEVSLNRKKAAGVPAPKGEIANLIADATATWPEWEQEQPLLLLEPDGNGWRGTVTDLDGVQKPVSYDTRIGLRISAPA